LPAAAPHADNQAVVTPFAEYTDYDGLGLAELVVRGDVHPSELLAACIARIEADDPRIGAVVRRLDEMARRSAAAPLPDGPFRGVPMFLKDLLADLAGVPTGRGSRLFADAVAERDCELVRRFKAAGLVIAGKTNTPELGITPTTEPEHHGPTRNPWSLAHSAGGSSGGSAAAVAARIVPIASGGDGGGSIRIPASCCGVFGLKPSRGRNPSGPHDGERWRGMVSEHVLTRSVRDSAAMLDATAGADLGAPYEIARPARPYLQEVTAAPGRLRIAFTAAPLLPSVIDPECIDGLHATATLLGELGHEVLERAPEVDGPAFARAFLTVLCANVCADLDDAAARRGRPIRASDVEYTTWALALLGRQIRAGDYERALRHLQRASRRVAELFTDVDVLLTPTLATPPPLLGALAPRGAEALLLRALGRLHAGKILDLIDALGSAAAKAYSFIPFTPIFNATGQPAMSVPLWWSAAGLPVGMQFVGRSGDEATLFRLAGQLERARPWADRRPPLRPVDP
jgi:amidase